MRHSKKWLNAKLTAILIAIFLTPALLFAQPENNDPSTEEDVQQEAEEAQRALDLFLRNQKLLYKKGEMSFEFSAFYSTNIQDTVWQNTLAKNIYRALNSSFTVRYGLMAGLELNINLPYGYAEQKIESIGGSTRFNKTDDDGLRDIRAGLKYQFLHEDNGKPDLIADIAYQSPAGNTPLLGLGHNSIDIGVTFVKTVDPVVFFGRIGYKWTEKKSDHDPSDEIAFQGGLGLSLNDRVSVNLQSLGRLVMREKRKINGEQIQSTISEFLSLQISVTAIINKQLSLEPVVGFGLTDNANDSYVGINIPYRF